MPDRLGAVAAMVEVYGDGTPEDIKRIVEQYRELRRYEDLLRDLAGFCFAASAVDSSAIPLERAEGRREVFWRIMSLIESDPLRVAKFLGGENLG